mmetsp:Transcript_16291/g.30842  ORF Transcript_16291/g.30842 Transcript_16291/m.30842 type:complete len:179 (+) Transcript_16291:1853-2389(+)
MAKKKHSTKASKKSSNPASADGIGLSSPEDKIQHLEAVVKSLELELANKVEMCASTMTQHESTKQLLDETMKNLEGEKKLMNKINEREKLIQQMTDNLNAFKTERENEIKEKDEIIKEKEYLLQQKKEKMNEMCEHFASMMRNITTQLTERTIIQSHNTNKVPMEQQLLHLQDFNCKN